MFRWTAVTQGVGCKGTFLLLFNIAAGWDSVQPIACRRSASEELLPTAYGAFRFTPSSSCQNIWFHLGEIFVVIFPSGSNYCHWNINGCPAGLIDFICVPSCLWSATDKSEPCFAGTLIKRPQSEELRVDESKDEQISDVWARDSSLQRLLLLLEQCNIHWENHLLCNKMYTLNKIDMLLSTIEVYVLIMKLL